MTTLVVFGDDYVRGTELLLNRDGSRTWTGQIAQRLGWEYHNFGVPGVGNEAIARNILSWIDSADTKDSLVVINWTWTQRWDFYITQYEDWTTIGPTAQPREFTTWFDKPGAERFVEYYNEFVGRSLLWNKWRSLQTINSVQSCLSSLSIPSVQTCIDDHLLNGSSHAPGYVRVLQNNVREQILTWQGMNFLQWCEHHDHELTQTCQPGQSAHDAAADLWQNHYQEIL
jgi:hypothetical protein